MPLSTNALRNFERQAQQSRNEKVLASVLKKTVKDDHRTLASAQEYSPIYENAILDDRAWDREMSRRMFMWADDADNPQLLRREVQKVGDRLHYANMFFAKVACTHTDASCQCRKVSRMHIAPDHHVSLVSAFREAATEERKIGPIISAAAMLGQQVFSYAIKHRTLDDALATQTEMLGLRSVFGADVCTGITAWNLHDNTVIGLIAFDGYDGGIIGVVKELTILLGRSKSPPRVEEVLDPTRLRLFYRQYPETMKRIGVDRVLNAYIERKLVAFDRAADKDAEAEAPVKRKRTTNLRWRRSNGIFMGGKKIINRAYELINPDKFPDLAAPIARHMELDNALTSSFVQEDGEYADAWYQAEDLNVLQKRARAVECEAMVDIRASNVVLGVLRIAKAKARKHKREHAPAKAPEEIKIAKPIAHLNTLCKVHGKPMHVVEVVTIGRDGGNVKKLAEWVRREEAPTVAAPTTTVVMPPKPVTAPFKPIPASSLFTPAPARHVILAANYAPLVPMQPVPTPTPHISDFAFMPSYINEDGETVW